MREVRGVCRARLANKGARFYVRLLMLLGLFGTNFLVQVEFNDIVLFVNNKDDAIRVGASRLHHILFIF